MLDDIRRVKDYLKSIVLHTPDVLRLGQESSGPRYGHIQKKVKGVFVIIIQLPCDTVTKQAKLHSDIELLGLFPYQIRIRNLVRKKSRNLPISSGTIEPKLVIVIDLGVTGKPKSSPECQEAYGVVSDEETFFKNNPSC